MNKRKNCPFCGSSDNAIDATNIGEFNPVKYFAVYCKKCKARTGLYRTTNEAETAWNRREENE